MVTGVNAPATASFRSDGASSQLTGIGRSIGRRRLLQGAALLAGTAAVAGALRGPVSGALGSPGPSAGLRLGVFPNVTHAPGLVALESGRLAARLADVGVPAARPIVFGNGTEAVEALFAGALDVAYLGANPTINAHVRSGGRAVRVISGATIGGAALVVQPGVRTAADLRGRIVATPGLGTTQDVALRTWLADEGLPVTIEGAGDVVVAPQANATAFTAFGAGAIAGAWVPEPWATRLVRDAGGVLLVDERERWPSTGGRYVTTQLVVRADVLRTHASAVAALLAAHLDALQLLADDRSTAIDLAGAAIEGLTGRAVPPDTLAASFERLEFSSDPLPDALRLAADHAVAAGLLDLADLGDAPFDDLYDLALLDAATRPDPTE
jgi:NitT/TauT family transport system substrate-binding protein